jgi:D-alanyl-lipoteichoic acid acyltransferase DltB (MBOAT superfamily)
MTSHALIYVVTIPFLWLLFRPFKAARSRQLLALAASYLLYATWGIGFLALLFGSSVTNYCFGRLLRVRQTPARLWSGILANIVLLCTFKYIPELLPVLKGSQLAPALARIVQPIGISFWTFQALSYLFDTYRADALEPSFTEFLLYMAFWPTVLSGPICRLPQLLPQFRSANNPALRDVSRGMDRICIGLCMIGLGSMLANGVYPEQGLDRAFQLPAGSLSGLDVWCLAFGYGLELFFNFAGYSHVVIGAARLFGWELAENFDRPYLATTVSEFWTRWHMSLSSWIRDYLFLPLAMLKRSTAWRNGALVLSMLVFGLWHKGTALLALWGLYHGVLLVLHRQWQGLARRLHWNWSGVFPTFISWLATITLVCLGWILFRSDSLPQAAAMIHAIGMLPTYLSLTLPHSLYYLVLLLFAGYLAIAKLAAWIPEGFNAVVLPPEARVALYSIAIYIGILHTAQTQAFIYFQF